MGTREGKKSGQAVSTSNSDETEGSDQENSDGQHSLPFAGAKPTNSIDVDDLDDDIDQDNNKTVSDSEAADFIVEDDSQVVAPRLPTAFSMNTHQDLAHHFKVICQLFVHLAVIPEKERRAFMEQTMKGKLSPSDSRFLANTTIRSLLEEEYFSVPLQIAQR